MEVGRKLFHDDYGYGIITKSFHAEDSLSYGRFETGGDRRFMPIPGEEPAPRGRMRGNMTNKHTATTKRLSPNLLYFRGLARKHQRRNPCRPGSANCRLFGFLSQYAGDEKSLRRVPVDDRRTARACVVKSLEPGDLKKITPNSWTATSGPKVLEEERRKSRKPRFPTEFATLWFANSTSEWCRAAPQKTNPRRVPFFVAGFPFQSFASRP
jgi:hypothetical protein